MRKFTVTFYANSEYSVRERLQEIDNSISNIVWPYPSNIDSSKTRTKKLSGSIEEEKQYQLSDYEYEKEDPTWKYGRDYVTTCLLYTSPSPRDLSTSRMPSSA